MTTVFKTAQTFISGQIGAYVNINIGLRKELPASIKSDSVNTFAPGVPLKITYTSNGNRIAEKALATDDFIGVLVLDNQKPYVLGGQIAINQGNDNVQAIYMQVVGNSVTAGSPVYFDFATNNITPTQPVGAKQYGIALSSGAIGDLVKVLPTPTLKA